LQLYIVGKAKLNDIDSIHREKLTVQLFNDIKIAKTDLVNIFYNNNQYVKAKLVLEGGTEKAKVIDLDVKELSTQCTNVGFAQDPLFDFKNQYY
jgi:hypothetical protein